MSLSQRQWQELQLRQWADHENAQWDPSVLDGWDQTKRLKLIIDSDLIDADLTDFPVAIFLSTSCGIGAIDASVVFDELTSDANRFKIAVTTADGVTQCYVEIENWDDASELAALHIKVPFISSAQDTELYLYFDSDHADNTDYVGDTGDAAAQAVWDSDFVAVWHMAQDPSGGAGCILNSVSSSYTGTPQNMVAGDLVDGLNGKGLSFGTNKCIVTDITGDGLDGGDRDWSIMLAVKPTDISGTEVLLSKGESASHKDYRIFIADQVINLDYERDNLGEERATSGNELTADWQLIVGTYESSSRQLLLYRNDSQIASHDSTNEPSDGDQKFTIGATYAEASSAYTAFYAGVIDDIRFHAGKLSAAWIKATYHTLFDTLVTVEETWLYGWGKKRLQLTIDSSKIDGNLTDFPLTIHLGADSGLLSFDALRVFTELSDSDRFKIAITANDHQAQQYIEIEAWDSANGQATLHTKVASILAAADTQLFLYFDSDHADNTDYVGDTGDAAAQSVWDDNFLEVIHMYDGTTLKSSIDGTTLTIAGSLAEVDGPNGGNALQANDDGDYIDYPSLAFTNNFTIEAQAYIDAGGPNPGYDMIMGEERTISLMAHHTSGTYWGLYLGNNSSWDTYKPSNSALSEATWYNLAAVYNAGAYNYYKNGAADGSGSGTSRSITSTFNIFGRENAPSALYYFHGKMAEFRISTGSRSAAWIKATYHSLFDTLIAIVDDTAIVFALDIIVKVGTASITWSVPAATVSVAALAGTPAQIAWSVLAAAVGVGADVATPEIIWSALEAAVTQNLNAIGIMSKPVVSAKGPSITVTVKAPSATVTFVKPSITATGKSPNITVTGKGPSATVTAKGE